MCEIPWRDYGGSDQSGIWENLYLETLINRTGNQKFRFVSSEESYINEQIITEEADSREIGINSGENGESAKAEIADMLNVSENESGKLLNGMNRKTFMTAVFIPSPNDINPGEIIDYDSLKKIILNDTSMFFHKYTQLSDALNNSGVSNTSLMREILKHEGKLKELNKEIQIQDIQSTRINKLKKEKSQIETDIKSLKEGLKDASARIGLLKKMHHDTKILSGLNEEIKITEDELLSEKKKIIEVSKIKKEIKNLFPSFYNLTLDEIPNLDTIQEKFISLRNTNERIDSLLHWKEKRLNAIKRFALTGNVAAMTAALTLLYKNGFDPAADTVLLAGIGSFVVLFNAILVILGLISRKTGELEELNYQVAEQEENIKEMLSRSRIDFNGNRLGELYEFLLQYFEEYIEFTERNRDLAMIRDSLKEKEYIRDIEKKLNSQKEKQKRLSGEIKYSAGITSLSTETGLHEKMIREKIEEFESDVESYLGQISSKEKLLEQVNSEIDKNRESGATNGNIKDELERAEKTVRRLHSQQNTINFVYDVLKSAVKNREQDRLKRLLSGALENFNYITGNQYITRIGTHSLEKMIFMNEKNEDFNPALYHALLLSLKIALTDLITETGEPLPLICDDPFLFMDEDRISRTRQMFNIVSDKRQVIIFTHLKSLNDWGTCLYL